MWCSGVVIALVMTNWAVGEFHDGMAAGLRGLIGAPVMGGLFFVAAAGGGVLGCEILDVIGVAEPLAKGSPSRVTVRLLLVSAGVLALSTVELYAFDAFDWDWCRETGELTSGEGLMAFLDCFYVSGFTPEYRSFLRYLLLLLFVINATALLIAYALGCRAGRAMMALSVAAPEHQPGAGSREARPGVESRGDRHAAR